MSRLIPKTIHLQADLKKQHSFEYTSGSGVGVTFTVPPDMEEPELKKALHEEQKKLARFVAVSEFLKGSIDQSELQNRLTAIDNGYGRLNRK